MSVLNAHKHFIAPAASPILLNISIILSTIFLMQLFTEPISAVAIGVVIGGAAQLLFQLPFLAKFNLLVFPKLNFRLSPFKKLLKLLIPSIFGVAIYQLNLIVLRQLGSYLPNGQISYYYNADRLMQCALGIFAFSIATAALPQMSIKSIKDDKNALLNTWIFTTKLTNFITLPASLGLIAISIPLVSILYLHGKFNLYDVKMTAYTTMSFAPGLITTAINRITVQAFFALEDMKTPVYVGTITLFINIIIGLALLPYEIIGLGLTLSISSLIQMLILITLLTMKLNYKNYRKLLFSFIEQFTLAFWAALSAYLITTFGTWELGANIKNLLILSLSLIVSSLIYFILALKLKIYEAQILCNIFILKNKKRYYN
jgi:putative peptidoglycan lipid II flippase